jgi:hypothetical protein
MGEGSAHDHSNDTGTVGAERHADADFASAAGDGEGGDAVESDDGEQESQRTK